MFLWLGAFVCQKLLLSLSTLLSHLYDHPAGDKEVGGGGNRDSLFTHCLRYCLLRVVLHRAASTQFALCFLTLDRFVLSTKADGCCRPHSGGMLIHPKITKFTGAVAELTGRAVLQLALRARLANSAFVFWAPSQTASVLHDIQIDGKMTGCASVLVGRQRAAATHAG